MEDGWRHLLTIPRELKVASDNSLLMTPIEELKNYVQKFSKRRYLEHHGIVISKISRWNYC